MTLASVQDHTGVFLRIILPRKGRCYRKFRQKSHGESVTLLIDLCFI